MQFGESNKKLPTARQFYKTNEPIEGTRYSVSLVLTSDEYKSFTFICEEFRILCQFDSLEEYEKAYKEVLKLSKKGCLVYGKVVEEKILGFIEPAQEHDEIHYRLTQVDYGFKVGKWISKN